MRKTLRNYALIASMLLASVVTFAQSKITGTVVDAETGEGLPGASVVLKGTTNGTITDFNGDFSLTTGGNSATIQVSFVGFSTVEKTINLRETQSFGKIELNPGGNELTPLEVIASVAIERETPVAVSTIKRTFIEENASNQEFPELLKSTPGVYATKQGGGYGDSRINVRGFNDENVAVLINGVPVNDMENGNVYWSNWAGLTDVTTSMQVQRGLGASKVAVPSIGGTINIITKTTDIERGGNIYQGFGNNGYLKTSFALNTGLTDNNWAVSISGAKIEGDGWVDGTEFLGYNYFFNVSKVIGDHTLSFTGFGAPQRHGQRQNMQSIEKFRDAPQEIKYNADWGYRNGQVVHVEDNFYHKPQFSLNHYWTISPKSELATAVYLSTGTGGGGGTATEEDAVTGDEPSFGDFRTGGEYSPYDIDAMVDYNQTSSDGRALIYQRASMNNHRWYGILSTYTHELTDEISLLAGIDGRYYKGIHFSKVYDMFGAEYVYDNADINNPDRALQTGDKRDYYYDGLVGWTGGFLQGEYISGPWSAFLTLSASNTSYRRIDYYNYLDSDPDQETPWQNFFGYQVKGGANYKITRNHNVFANIGYFEKAPGFDAVFLNNQNDINADAENQKIFSTELGYGFQSAKFSGNVNVYRTGWMDRTFTDSFQDNEGNLYFANILGVDALHQGVELDFNYHPVQSLTVYGMLSVGDWTWQENVKSVNILDEEQNVVETIDELYIADLKVGGSAQTTGAIGIDYNIVSSVKVGVLYTYFDDFYADYDPTTRTDAEVAGVQAWKVPSYHLFDIKVRYDFNIGDLNANFYANANNLFDVEYISDAQDSNSTAAGASVYYGVGRTWTTGLKINF